MAAALLLSCAYVSYSCLLLYYLLYLILMFSYMFPLYLPTQPSKPQVSEVTFLMMQILILKSAKLK